MSCPLKFMQIAVAAAGSWTRYTARKAKSEVNVVLMTPIAILYKLGHSISVLPFHSLQ